MELIVFSKAFKDRSVPELVALAQDYGVDGWDLCVRPEYAVSPENAATALPEAARLLAAEGLRIPLVTGNFDLLEPDHPTAEPILSAMDQADIRLLKLGYYHFDPATQDYWAEVDRVRKLLEGWQALGERYGVKILNHTHSNRCLGLNCSCLMHLLRGFDPRYLGAYLDPAHLLVEGEEFAVGLGMVKGYLSAIGMKDVALLREVKKGHGTRRNEWTPAGQGMVDWTTVFADLLAVGYDGPLSVHCEFEVPAEEVDATLRREVRFFRETIQLAQSASREAK
jgi:sugar phosphate isomerase/epimerase